MMRSSILNVINVFLFTGPNSWAMTGWPNENLLNSVSHSTTNSHGELFPQLKMKLKPKCQNKTCSEGSFDLDLDLLNLHDGRMWKKQQSCQGLTRLDRFTHYVSKPFFKKHQCMFAFWTIAWHWKSVSFENQHQKKTCYTFVICIMLVVDLLARRTGFEWTMCSSNILWPAWEGLTLLAKFFCRKYKNVSTVYVIPQYWLDAGSWNPSSCKTRTYLFCIVNRH